MISEQEQAFSAFREALKPWKEKNRDFSVVIGGESFSGEWSLLFENNYWTVFIGERGERHSICYFTNVWDALSYVGYRVTAGLNPSISFPVLMPKLNLS